MTDSPTAVPLRTRVLREAAWLALYVPLALAFTWPLARKFTTALAGERDSWQNLWNIVWLKRSLLAGHTPFFTHALWHPDGATLIFQTFDLPDSVWAAAVVGFFGLWPTYNLAVLWTFVASGAAMYALGRGTGSSRPASFLAGCAYTFSTYHFTHALAHLHLLAMQWAPLFVLALFRIMEDPRRIRDSLRWAIGGGVLLVLASLSSWYYLFDLFVVTLALVPAWILRSRGKGFFKFTVRGAVLCLVFLALIGPLGRAMVKARASDQFEGAHPAGFYSADLQSFVLANDAQWLGEDAHWPELVHWPRLKHALLTFSQKRHLWTGNAGENAAYLGFFIVLLVFAGLVMRAPRVGGYVFAALIGIALALGPELHIGGVEKTGEVMPYAKLMHAFPLLDFMGMPVRFAWVATFGLAAALAPALDALRRKVSWIVLAPIAAAGVLEHSPHAFVTTQMPTPAPMVQWAREPEPYAVLDTCAGDEPKEWHQTLHGHPTFGTNLSRTPERLKNKLNADPVAGPMFGGDTVERHDRMHLDVVDTTFPDPVSRGAEKEHFSIELSGTLHVAKDGLAAFRLLSDDGAWIAVDGRHIIDSPGPHPLTEKKGSVPLIPGDHVVTLHYDQKEGEAELHAWWSPPGQPERLLGGADVPGGFTGVVTFRRHELAITRDQALAHLHKLDVRYIVQCQEEPDFITEVQLGLPRMYEGADVRIYRVPPEAPPPPPHKPPR